MSPRNPTFGQQCRVVADEIQELTGEMLFSGFSNGLYFTSDSHFVSGQKCLEWLKEELDKAKKERGL